MSTRNDGWFAIEFELPPRYARDPARYEDEFIGRAVALTRGIELFDSGDGGRGVRLVLANGCDPESACREVCGLLSAIGIERVQPQIHRVADEQWAERYQESLRPFDLGQRFRVFPAGRLEECDQRTPIVLIPGRAFGTGEHATTRMCVEALEHRVVAGSRWLDLGCGTAILALVASHLGAAEVQALDLDSQAIEVATEVLEANRAPRNIELTVGTIPGFDRGRFDGVVANIHAPHFLNGASALRQQCREGAPLLATGFSVDDADEVAPALEAAGFAVESRNTQPPWALLIARSR